MRVFVFLLTAWFLGMATATASLADTITGRVVGVVDGDTLDLLWNGRATRIRLQGINTTERGEPYYQKGKTSLSELVYGKEVVVELNGETNNGRLIGVVFSGGENINLEQVRRGLAWHCANYLPSRDFSEAEAKARKSVLGIHSVTGLARPPWCKN